MAGSFFYGVIEGFYGRQWSWAERMNYAPFLARHGFDCYLYAPKGEPHLRASWREPLPAGLAGDLCALGDCYRRHGLRWGLGLSPLGLGEHFDTADAQLLADKIKQLNALGPDLLCILFDDTRGDIAGLARRQVAVVETVLEHSSASRHIVCPTYYSFDPVLEQVFGERPPGYLEDLGSQLPPEVDIFWTGDRVISDSIGVADVERAASAFGRAPVLWDNYPVNDGRKTSAHLHLAPYAGRSPELAEIARGHVVNPMNQATLSQIVLQSLGLLYSGAGYDAEQAWQSGLAELQDPRLAAWLNRDRELFQEAGLEALSETKRRALLSDYGASEHPAAREVVAWLEGQYVFDPACLTDGG